MTPSRILRYIHSEKGKATRLQYTQRPEVREYYRQYAAQYRKTEAYRKAQKKYRLTEKGKAAIKRHNSTASYKIARKRFDRSPKGIIANKNLCAARYNKVKDGHVSAEQWQTILEQFSHRCAYCGQDGILTMDHYIPLKKGGQHCANNVVPACKSCNSQKNARHPLRLF